LLELFHRRLTAELGLDTLLVVNDFAALAMSLPHLGPSSASALAAASNRRAGRSA
jgi:glucokinase